MLRLLTPSVLKAIHGGVGALGLAGMVYGVKKAIDAAAEKKAKEMAGGALGAPGYQLVPQRFILPSPMGKNIMSAAPHYPYSDPVTQSTGVVPYIPTNAPLPPFSRDDVLRMRDKSYTNVNYPYSDPVTQSTGVVPYRGTTPTNPGAQLSMTVKPMTDQQSTQAPPKPFEGRLPSSQNMFMAGRKFPS